MKRYILIAALILGLASPAHAIMLVGFGGGAAPSIAYDAKSFSTTETGNMTWNHVPVGTPRGVIVFVFQYANGADHVTAVTYGGTAMTEVALSQASKITGEAMTVYAYFLGSSIPTGTQEVVVTVDSAQTKSARCVTLTANGDTSITDTTKIESDSVENPSATLSLGGVESFCAMVFMSGHDDTTSVTSLPNWSVRSTQDFGTEVARYETYDIVGSTDVTFGETQTAEDFVAIGVAVRIAP